jgi:hypothetical protein
MFLFIYRPLNDPRRALVPPTQQLSELPEEFEKVFPKQTQENPQLLHRSNVAIEIKSQGFTE